MRRQYHKWFSPALGREMELLVFGHAGAKVMVFPTREGRFYDYENWGLVDALRGPVEGGYIRLFCVDGVDSETLYCRSVPPVSRVERHRNYERYILQEVIPFMISENGVPSLILHGCSIGAYHAMSLALRHPWLFCKVVALSGRYDLTRCFGSFEDLFSGHYDQDVYFITPNHFCPTCMTRAISSPSAAWISPSRWVNTILSTTVTGRSVTRLQARACRTVCTYGRERRIGPDFGVR